jgi:hypothetical protein
MSVWKQALSIYLALCVALAGAIGLSPTLHRLIEHGGLGPTHSHVFPSSGMSGSAEKASFADLMVHHRRAFTFPRLPVGEFWHTLAHLLETTSEQGAAEKKGNGHEHHSLAQMMASGLAEQSLDAIFLSWLQPTIVFQSFPPEALLLTRNFDLHSAGRAPPSAST